MDPRFDRLVSHPSNDVFQVVFFPDRVYHAQYLNATRSPRYRYNVHEVRAKAETTVLKGEVFVDGVRLAGFLRVEYQAYRLSEQARLRSRFLRSRVMASLSLTTADGGEVAIDALHLHWCPWVRAFQVELWETLETPAGQRHDYQVLDLMGHEAAITRVSEVAPLLADPADIQKVTLAYREARLYEPTGFTVSDAQAARDDFYGRNVQVPNTPEPSSAANTVPAPAYELDFRRGWFIADVGRDVAPVRYRNALLDDDDPRRRDDNIIEMRWILQQEFGGRLVFFHEVTIPVGTVEGTHRHIGSEELYYVVEGTGFAYMGVDDDPTLADDIPVVTRRIFGLDDQPLKQVPVGPGSVIFTKSGGIHGIENGGRTPLRFVAFLYHSA